MIWKVIRAVAPIIAAVCLYFAYTCWDEADALDTEATGLEREVSQLRADVEGMKKLAVRPLLPRTETLEAFLAHMIDDTELLGSSVRLNIDGGGIKWLPVRFDVEKTKLSLSTGDVTSASLGYTYILWQIMQRQPSRVVSASIAAQGEVVSITVEVELFALSEGTG